MTFLHHSTAIALIAAAGTSFAQSPPPTGGIAQRAAVQAVPVSPAPAQPPAQSNHTYVKVDGVTGEVVDPAHAGWIEINSFRWNTPTAGAAGGAGRTSARQATNITSMSITKPLDKTSPALQKTASEGRHIKTVVLDVESRQKQEYYRVTMTDVLVSSVHSSAGGERPSESVTFNFAKFEVKYGKVDAQGRRGALQTAPESYDVRLITGA